MGRIEFIDARNFVVLGNKRTSNWAHCLKIYIMKERGFWNPDISECIMSEMSDIP